MNKHRPRLPLLAACALTMLASAACGAREPFETREPTAAVQIDTTPIARPADPVVIERAEIRGDELRLHLRYGGGCAEHAFTLHTEGAFMESDPVQLRLHLAHDAHGDNCRALLSREVAFDLRPVRELYRQSYGTGGTVVLHVHAPGADAPIQPALRYDF